MCNRCGIDRGPSNTSYSSHMILIERVSRDSYKPTGEDSWKMACKKAVLGVRLFHDLHANGPRNMVNRAVAAP
jgi:hypothetical protein